MFLIRQAGPADFAGVYRLAKLLDSYNLPGDPVYIRRLLEISRDSFQGRLPRSTAKYLFVLESVPFPGVPGLLVPGTPGNGTVVGCSLIIAKHGTPGHPHLWFALDKITKRSRTLGIRRSHHVLRLGFTENGPTEVGGLIVLPGYRRHVERCGLQISFVRFLYMAIHPARFEPKVLVEYRGAMGTGNTSIFWDRVGRVFTGLPYPKADRLSVTNKEFIRSLLPHEPIYCALLPTAVQHAIGAVHPSAQRAAGLLQRIGFRPIRQIEPFDGGPYYTARRREIRLIRGTHSLPVAASRRKTGASFLVGTERGGAFRAVVARGKIVKDWLFLGQRSLKLLHVCEGEKVYACPI